MTGDVKHANPSWNTIRHRNTESLFFVRVSLGDTQDVLQLAFQRRALFRAGNDIREAPPEDPKRAPARRLRAVKHGERAPRFGELVWALDRRSVQRVSRRGGRGITRRVRSARVRQKKTRSGVSAAFVSVAQSAFVASRADDGEGRPAASPAATATSSPPPAEVRGVSDY